MSSPKTTELQAIEFYAQTGMMPTRIPEMEAEGVRTLCSDCKGEVEGTEGGT